ncbi:MAG: aminotransferase class I/II-fold pyridoxal phosphate-dependent enzyme [Thaumarchaeota archaeon]|nr:aminotransferase class I/II-fold pyridoxal phosphate-dependent enzyme [Nitrososphaerota archaeon]
MRRRPFRLKRVQGEWQVSDRVKLLPSSTIKEMTRLSNRHGAINLAQGCPDFSAPETLKSAAIRAIKEGYNQYEISHGSAKLRERIARKLREYNGIEADWEENITVTCGSTEAMMDTVIALTDPGDEVIVTEPFYENYVPATVISGARPKYVRLTEPDFRFDEEKLKEKFSSKTKLMIVNTPNNPSGRVFNKAELKLVADLCKDHDVTAITDEIYERIVYKGYSHLSLATLPGMAERTVTISGISKTFSVTGWRVGYAVAPRRLTKAIRKVHDYMTVCAPSPLQRAAAEGLAMPGSYYKSLRDSYERKRRFMLDSLGGMGFKCVEPQGAYYILADFTQFSKSDDFAFSNYLVRRAAVAVLPASSFYATKGAGKNMVRFSYCKRDQTLKEAVQRLKRALN